MTNDKTIVHQELKVYKTMGCMRLCWAFLTHQSRKGLNASGTLQWTQDLCVVSLAVGQGCNTVRKEEGGKSLCFEVHTVFVEMAGLCGYNKSSQRLYVTECT